MVDLLFFNRRIRTSLLIGFMLFIILPALAVGLFSYVQTKKVMEQSVFNSLQYLVNAQENAINNWFNARKHFLEGLAQNEKITGLDYRAMQNVLSNALKMDENFLSLMFVGTDGEIKADPVYQADLGRISVVDREYFRQALEGKTYVSEVLLSKITRKPVIVIATPVKREQHIAGVLFGAVNINVITKLVQQNFPGAGGQAYLINQEGLILNGAEPKGLTEQKLQNIPVQQLSRGISGQGIYIDYLHKQVFGVYRWLPSVKLGLVVEKEYTGALLENGLATYLKVVLASTVIIGLFISFALYYSRRLSRPLEQLAAEVNSIAEGRFRSVVDLQANKEVQALVYAINNMSSNLCQKTTQLNKLVNQLEQSAAELQQEKNKLAQISITDELTGLYNRRYINQELDRFTRLSRTLSKNISVMLLDLDHFKAVNDTYGHAAGDAVLKEFARLVKLCSRRTDVVGRFGGEEFMIILPFISSHQVKDIAERIRQDVSNHVFEADNFKIKITVSIGAVTLVPPAQAKVAETIEKMIKTADDCLYAAKRAGRNRVVQVQVEDGLQPALITDNQNPSQE
ncbi:sensor domain-containing diguanylate cyclase [Desulforamulus hydrothermalis]|uniref:Diguanylate cyclase n=1 Tax=Desulforamulus hydrothermalis Lam5 = DSM 18033 TaxID=1121428 RepID=K8DZW4_9FIRM|nr:diguanylate cyclase [Desulforamulus hydrothermalis]CCO08707.1 Diguanylate cyclase [Desulforamulus hydrothermalis Lam5 = DSM 18033]SHG69665.1 diguanylate cyclase [Desulforamulus hydrothermalis Lam5 = DSM 18033]